MPLAFFNNYGFNRVAWHGPGDEHGLALVARYSSSAVGHCQGRDPHTLTDH
jgi:hypothetical protein